MNPDDLFHPQTGIYVNPTKKGTAWRRSARLHGEDIEISIHGSGSRQRSPQKSFRIYSRHGFSFFADKKVLVLRAGFNDTWTHDQRQQQETAIYIKDQVVRNLFSQMGFWTAKGLWAELFINNQFWGLYNVTERIASNDKITTIDENDEFSLQAKDIDVDNFTAYIITNIWLQNYDWPQKNWAAWRENAAGAKWNFTIWDAEYSFGSGIQGYKVKHNTVYHFLKSSSPIKKLFVQLLNTPGYKKYFWGKVEFYLKNFLNEKYLTPLLESDALVIRPTLPKVIARWAPGRTLADFNTALEKAKNFTAERTPYFVRYWRSAIGDPPATFAAELLRNTEPSVWDRLIPWKDYLDYVF